MMSRTNIFLTGLLVAVVILTAMTGVDHSKPNLEFLPDMKYTPAWTAFEINPNFPNGRTMQEPVPGTIARGEMPLYYAPTKEDALRAGEELLNPFRLGDLESENTEPQDKQGEEEISPAEAAQERLQASIDRGGDSFRIFCVACHGPTGAGDGLVPKRGFPPPPSLLTGTSLQMKDGQLFHILTYGQGSMAPFAGQLSQARRWDLVNYVRDLQNKTRK